MRNLSCYHSSRDVFWTWYFRKLTGILLNSRVIYLLTFEWGHLYPVSFSTLDDCVESQFVIRKQHTPSVKGKFPLHSLESLINTVGVTWLKITEFQTKNDLKVCYLTKQGLRRLLVSEFVNSMAQDHQDVLHLVALPFSHVAFHPQACSLRVTRCHISRHHMLAKLHPKPGREASSPHTSVYCRKKHLFQKPSPCYP